MRMTFLGIPPTEAEKNENVSLTCSINLIDWPNEKDGRTLTMWNAYQTRDVISCKRINTRWITSITLTVTVEKTYRMLSHCASFHTRTNLQEIERYIQWTLSTEGVYFRWMLFGMVEETVVFLGEILTTVMVNRLIVF